MRFAVFGWASPACKRTYEAALMGAEFAKECPYCHQMNVTYEATRAVSGRCDRCSQPLDDHLFGRQDANVCCPPRRRAT